MSDFNLNNLEKRMNKAVQSLNNDFSALRTGRASTTMLDPIVVDAYASKMPLNQLASVSAPEARMLSISVWDQTLVKAVEKAILDSNLGLNPQTEGSVIRLPVPELNEERRVKLTRVASKYAEQARVVVRSIRRDGMETLKKSEKNGEISNDDLHRENENIQNLTDRIIAQINTLLSDKETEIMQV
ncbi:MAG: ribosome recycling factor [Pseudomonadota bacterium]